MKGRINPFMKTQCFKCKSNDIINVDGIIMCNNCGEILNANSKKDLTLKIDKIISKKPSIKYVKINSNSLSKLKINKEDNEESILEEDFYELLTEDYVDDYNEEYDLGDEGTDIMDNEDLWTYIDDIEGLDEDLHDSNYNDEYEEKYPGLLVVKEHK